VGYFSQEALDELTQGLAELPPQLRSVKAAYAGRGLCERPGQGARAAWPVPRRGHLDPRLQP
jgi:hypothetical protein